MRVLFAPASSKCERVLSPLTAAGVDVELVIHRPGGAWQTVKWLAASTAANLSRHADIVLTDACNTPHLMSVTPRFFRHSPVVFRPRGDAWSENASSRPDAGVMRSPASLSEALLPTLYRRADAIAAVSSSLGQTIIDRCAIDESKLTVIREPVDLERFTPVEDRSAAKSELDLQYDHVVCLVSNFVYPDKVTGIERFLPVLHALVEKHPDVAVVVAGGGPLHAPFCERNARWLEHARIIVPGFIDTIELLYQAADFLVHFSFLDTLALVLFEAWACGVPVVVNDYPAFRENVKPGETGYIVSNEADPQEALPIFERLLYDDEHRYELGSRGRRYAEEHASVEVLAEQYLNLFAELLG
ncbi:MAG: glycosyltransferase family 4 protein [Armatimonadota bacterium]